MVCLGFEPGAQDGRRRQNQGAVAATVVDIIKLILEEFWKI